MSTLSKAQINQFHKNGFLFLENAIPSDTLQKMQIEFEHWKEESRLNSLTRKN